MAFGNVCFVATNPARIAKFPALLGGQRVAEVEGGNKLAGALERISNKLQSGASVSVGFLSNALYADGTSVAMVAAINEFGGTINMPAHQQTIYRTTNKKQTSFLRKGRFVKRSKANFESTHDVAAYSITIPPRPFFRTMIAKNSGGWGKMMAGLMKRYKMDANKALDGMGAVIKSQLQDSIKAMNSPPNAKSTIRKKGFNKPLIDTGYMWNSIDWRVKT